MATVPFKKLGFAAGLLASLFSASDLLADTPIVNPSAIYLVALESQGLSKEKYRWTLIRKEKVDQIEEWLSERINRKLTEIDRNPEYIYIVNLTLRQNMVLGGDLAVVICGDTLDALLVVRGM